MFSVVSVILFREGILCKTPDPGPGLAPATDHTVQGPPVVQLGPHCTEPTDMFALVHYEADMVGKRTVGILLECFLVSQYKLAFRMLFTSVAAEEIFHVKLTTNFNIDFVSEMRCHNLEMERLLCFP